LLERVLVFVVVGCPCGLPPYTVPFRGSCFVKGRACSLLFVPSTQLNWVACRQLERPCYSTDRMAVKRFAYPPASVVLCDLQTSSLARLKPRSVCLAFPTELLGFTSAACGPALSSSLFCFFLGGGLNGILGWLLAWLGVRRSQCSRCASLTAPSRRASSLPPSVHTLQTTISHPSSKSRFSWLYRRLLP